MENFNEAGNDLTLSGIGGWLALLAIGVVLTPVLLLGSLVKTYMPIIIGGALGNLANTNFSLFILVLTEIIINTGFIVTSIIILFLFFGKKRNCPMWLIIFKIANLSFIIIDAVLAQIISESILDYPNLVRGIIPTVIWCLYLLKSRRVKNTFIN